MKYYNLIELFKAYKDNKHVINAHINNQTIEGYSRDTDNTVILGMTLEIFLLFFIISLVLWICALVLLINNWNIIPEWAKVVGVLGLLPIIPGGPIVTIVLVLIITKQQSR
jgi:hypothetical protein